MVTILTGMKTMVLTSIDIFPLPSFSKRGEAQRIPFDQRAIEGDFHGNVRRLMPEENNKPMTSRPQFCVFCLLGGEPQGIFLLWTDDRSGIMEVESNLVPILRDGIDVIKMLFFQKLKTSLAGRYSEAEPSHINRLAGAIINELFGTVHQGGLHAEFAEKNRVCIQQEMGEIPVHFPEMLIPLTDALRVQFLCDCQENVDSTSVLSRAKEWGILLTEREVPFPAQFMSLVRKLGSSMGVLQEMQ